MTQVISPVDADVKDFTQHVDVKFRIDDDIFIGLRGIPALVLMEFGMLFDGLSEAELAQHPDAFKKMIEMILVTESAEVFIRRMSDRDNPISLPQVMDILPWLMERYGMRPSEPSPNSSDGAGNPGDGTNLTEKAPQTALTS